MLIRRNICMHANPDVHFKNHAMVRQGSHIVFGESLQYQRYEFWNHYFGILVGPKVIQFLLFHGKQWSSHETVLQRCDFYIAMWTRSIKRKEVMCMTLQKDQFPNISSYTEISFIIITETAIASQKVLFGLLLGQLISSY